MKVGGGAIEIFGNSSTECALHGAKIEPALNQTDEPSGPVRSKIDCGCDELGFDYFIGDMIDEDLDGRASIVINSGVFKYRQGPIKRYQRRKWRRVRKTWQRKGENNQRKLNYRRK